MQPVFYSSEANPSYSFIHSISVYFSIKDKNFQTKISVINSVQFLKVFFVFACFAYMCICVHVSAWCLWNPESPGTVVIVN